MKTKAKARRLDARRLKAVVVKITEAKAICVMTAERPYLPNMVFTTSEFQYIWPIIIRINDLAFADVKPSPFISMKGAVASDYETIIVIGERRRKSPEYMAKVMEIVLCGGLPDAF